MRSEIAFFLSVLCGANLSAESKPQQLCVFVTSQGKVEQVNSPGDVPARYRSVSRCFDAKKQVQLAKPEEIELDGAIRKVSMASPVGRINLRWPRKVERLFGRTPERAMADAARSVSRALKSASFPPELRSLSVEWNVVFLDEDLPEKQVPSYLIDNCHPGWMTPPASIYIVAQRVAGGCGGNKMEIHEADAVLAEVLLHEMGHVVEFELMGGRMDTDRMRAEGFATWFAQLAADYSSVIRRGKLREYYGNLAREALQQDSRLTSFGGSSHDYARASLIFSAIVDRRGVGGLCRVYQVMGDERLEFLPAVERALSWDQGKLSQEAIKVAH